MNEKIPLKSIALGIAVTVASGLFVSMAGMVEQTQALDENEVYQTSENTSGNYTEYDEEDYTVTSWWKAVLSDYDEALSPGGLTETETQTEATTTEVVQTSETSVSETAVSDTMQNQPADTAAIPQQIERSYEEVKAGNFCFKTYGYGHGVGMSQNGANYYATYGGYDYKQILAHYYPGTYLSNTGTANSEYITVRGITADALSSLYTGAVTGLPNSIPNIKGIDIDKFEGVIDDKIGSLIGLYDKKKLPVKSSEDEALPVVNGNIKVTTDEDPGETMFFVKQDKEYSSDIKIVDSEVYVNNERMM